MKKRILIAEDDINIRSGLIDALEMDGHEAHGVEDGAAAISHFRQEKWDLLILDLMMPEKSGYEVKQSSGRNKTAFAEKKRNIFGITAFYVIDTSINVNTNRSNIFPVLRQSMWRHT